MNGERRDPDRNERPCGPQGREPAGRGEPDITALAARIQELSLRGDYRCQC